jgi:hypothetical protein
MNDHDLALRPRKTSDDRLIARRARRNIAFANSAIFLHCGLGYYVPVITCGVSMRPSMGRNKIDFRLINGLVSNYQYSNGDAHVTNPIEPADNVMTVATGC